jgi:hypothetical protein
MNQDHNHDIEYMIELMLEAGFTIAEIEKQLGVTIQGRVHVIEYVAQVLQSNICGEIEVNVN